MVSRGVQVIRIEATPATDHGYLTYFHKYHVQQVLLLSRAIMPTVSNKDLNSALTGPVWPKVLAAWQEAVAATLVRASGAENIDFIEVGNEPNTDQTAAGTGVKPANYAALFDAAYPLLRAHSPTTRIITGGVFAHATSGVDYLQAVQRESHYFPYADAVGWHPYLDSGGGLQVKHLNAFLQQLHTAFGKPIFVSEVGWQSTVISQDVQASNFAALFATCRASGLVEGVLAFSLKDSPESKPPLFYGIKDRIAWNQFKGY